MLATQLLCLGLLMSPGPYEPLPAEVVQAWEKAGAKYGWAKPCVEGYMIFSPWSKEGQNSHRHDIPAFQVSPTADLSDLPAPPTPFGV